MDFANPAGAATRSGSQALGAARLFPHEGLSGNMPAERTDPLRGPVSEELTMQEQLQGAWDGEHGQQVAAVHRPEAG